MPTELKYILIGAVVAALEFLSHGVMGLKIPDQYALLVPIAQAALVSLTAFLRRWGKPE